MRHLLFSAERFVALGAVVRDVQQPGLRIANAVRVREARLVALNQANRVVIPRRPLAVKRMPGV
jgi:hypothetical protein